MPSLKHSPKKIKGTFSCSNNNLESLEYCPKIIEGFFDCSGNKLKKELLHVFNSNITSGIFSDFGNTKDFLNEVIKQKLLKEKEELTKIINSTENGILTKKRL